MNFQNLFLSPGAVGDCLSVLVLLGVVAEDEDEEDDEEAAREGEVEREELGEEPAEEFGEGEPKVGDIGGEMTEGGERAVGLIK